MDIKRPLAPKFLNKLDSHLLLHKPETWSARTHLVIYYGILFIAALAGLCLIIPNDPRDESQVAYWIGFLVIVDVIALVVWLIYLLRFNVFKRYGNITPIGRLKTFGLYFVSVSIIVLFTYVPPVVESIRANLSYADKEIINDINNINTKICQLEYDSLEHSWKPDTLVVVNKIQTQPTVYSGDTMLPVTHPPYRVIDTADFSKKKQEIDSLVKLDDSTYVFFECPEYDFLKPYAYYNTYNYRSFFDRNSFKDNNVLMNSPDIFNAAIRNYQKPDTRKITDELFGLIKKYEFERYSSYYNSYEYAESKTFKQRLLKKYNIENINRSIENILDRKHRWDKENNSWKIRTFFYFAFIFTLLIFIFRHSTIKTFFISLLTAIILSVLTSIFMAFSSGRGDSGFLAWIIFYTIVFTAVACTVFSNRKRSIVSGIGINLFVLTISFLPLTIMSYYYSLIQKDYYGYGTPSFDYETMYRHLFYAEIGGIILLIALLPTLIHNLYRKWYALPEE